MKDGCQNHAIRLRAVVWSSVTTPSTCAFISAEPGAGGGASRTSLPPLNAHVLHCPASGATGFGLLQRPGLGGNEPVNTRSDPSCVAQAITCVATFSPTVSPALMSDSNSVPA